MTIELEGMAITMPVVPRHPNRQLFRGVLTLVDVASDRPPAGARGRRVLLTRAAAESALPSLLGMAVDYTPSLDAHDARHKVGIITRADIGDSKTAAIEVSGYLFARDFPDIIREMRGGGLGMSYEVCDAHVADMSAPVWSLTRVTFTGAAILRRDKAAYRGTWIELAEEATSH